MDSLAVGNMIWNGGLVVIIGYFIKKWMRQIEKNAEDNHKETKDTAVALKRESKEAADVLDNKIEKIFVELKTANGRTAKIEGAVESQRLLCDERHKVKRRR